MKKNMRKPKLTMETLINKNKKEILTNKEELARIDKKIDEKYNRLLQKK
jgi:hypothetical protein